MKTPFKVICLNDQDRPETVPTSKWVKKGEIYTVIKVDRINTQGGKLGVQLHEIDLTDCVPYLYFGIWRFGIPMSPEAIIREDQRVVEGELETA